MHYLLLSLLLILSVACSKGSGEGNSGVGAGIPSVGVPDVSLDLELVNNSGGSNNNSNSNSNSNNNSGNNSDDSSDNNSDDSDEVADDDYANNEDEDEDQNDDQDEEYAEASESKSCELISENQRLAVMLKLEENKVKLSKSDDSDLVVENFKFNPSFNENAAVEYLDGELMHDGKKVIKITARVVFDSESKMGELQISFRLKEKKGNSQTGFMVLADIKNCH